MHSFLGQAAAAVVCDVEESSSVRAGVVGSAPRARVGGCGSFGRVRGFGFLC